MLPDMPFDPATFEAEVALDLIPTERLPIVAQDALQAGFDGPRVVRMAILEPTATWEIHQALKFMLDELGLQSISHREAALRLARLRARRVLTTKEDPLLSCSYFYRLWIEADYIPELEELAWIDDNDFFFKDEDDKRAIVLEAIAALDVAGVQA
jgi:hypothetical protein